MTSRRQAHEGPAGFRRWAAACAAVLLSACATSAAIKAARSGDSAVLQRSIAAERASGKLDRARTRAIARAVAEREIAQPDGRASAARSDQAGGCARQLAFALRARAKARDIGAASALLALLDARELGGDADELIEAHAASPDPAWRAVAARASQGANHSAVRRRFYVDPDEGVRLAALRASLARPDPSDAPALLAVLRLDPNGLAQSLAARSLGSSTDPQVVLDLADAYASADEVLRQSIVDAWGAKSIRAGGERELQRVMETDRGLAAIEAASVLVRSGGSTETARLATRALVRAVGAGPSNERVLAIINVPLRDAEAREALTSATRDADESVKITALTRLAGDGASRAAALAELRTSGVGGNLPALLALAELNDTTAASGLARHVHSPSPATRAAAGRALIALAQEPSAAELLADQDADVRWSTACAMVAAEPP